MLNVYDTVCNKFSGKIGAVEAAAKDSGLFKGLVKIRYNTGESYFISPEHLVDVSRSAAIIRAGKKKSLPLADDDE